MWQLSLRDRCEQGVRSVCRVRGCEFGVKQRWVVCGARMRTDSYGGPLVYGRSASALTSLVSKGSAHARSSPRRLTRGLAARGAGLGGRDCE